MPVSASSARQVKPRLCLYTPRTNGLRLLSVPVRMTNVSGFIRLSHKDIIVVAWCSEVHWTAIFQAGSIVAAHHLMCVLSSPQVANLKKESAFHWFKNDVEVIPDVPADLSSGVCKLPLPLVRSWIHEKNSNALTELILQNRSNLSDCCNNSTT